MLNLSDTTSKKPFLVPGWYWNLVSKAVSGDDDASTAQIILGLISFAVLFVSIGGSVLAKMYLR